MEEKTHGVTFFCQMGNFFIMDSEQLVCKPFQDLQLEAVAVAEAQKKASMTERMTSVKNNVCENHLLMARSQLHREETQRLKQLHDSSSKLRYEVKLLDLDKQRHVMETKKRLMPERDYSYEELQLSNTERRLGANITSFYLQRRMRFPPRLKAGSVIGLTPTVRRARQALKVHAAGKKGDADVNDKDVDDDAVSRAFPAPGEKRRECPRSAPIKVRSGGTAGAVVRLPILGGDGSKGHVKVVPMQQLSKSMESDDQTTRASVPRRPSTYHPDTRTGRLVQDSRESRRETCDDDNDIDDDDDDDDSSLPDYLDLRALLFGQGDAQDAGGFPLRGRASCAQQGQTPSTVRRAQGLGPRVTQDLIQQENQHVQSKVHRFLHGLQTAVRHTATSDSDDDYDDEGDTLVTSRDQHQHAPATHSANVGKDGMDFQTGSATTQDQEGQSSSLRKVKNAWKYIRGRGTSANPPHGTYTTEELVLQALTGVSLQHALTAGVPFHCAKRALRHTATFKMQRVVEKLVSERTRYQQHEVQELKRMMEGDEADQPRLQSPENKNLELELEPAE
ncbi:uncharacterized protein LOC112576403 isoform X3 [Pomacea canaliculata]|uniref:uncharacterized protein LOC112576403 isoform X3 n=1 Tax=Pomacea canaliculata TaxID=400727 RepID=UPI000D733C62|nr:uncharacterized protein LOC112576403 isoform X3 [Pomacea canaliculata]